MALLLQERAAAYVSGIKQSPDCWKLCVERFGSSMYPEIKFWCLQTLQEVLMLLLWHWNLQQHQQQLSSASPTSSAMLRAAF